MSELPEPRSEYAPRTLWHITDSHGRTLDAVFVRTADRNSIAIRLDDQAKDARDFRTRYAALAWPTSSGR